MKKFNVGRRFVQLVIKDKEVEALDTEFLRKIALCYQEVFNESWGEEWTEASALREILKSFKAEEGREFIGTVLLRGEKVVGFSWGVVADVNAISPNRDMPFESPLNEKEDSLRTLAHWLEVSGGGQKVLIFREIGALKSVRGRLAGALAFHLLDSAIQGGAQSLFLWTSPKSAAFKLSLGLFWRPIYFFENGCLIMAGKTLYARNLAKKVLSINPIRVWSGYRELKRNIKNFFN